MTDMSIRETFRKYRYRWSGQVFLAELLSKRWMEPVVPFMAAVVLLIAFSILIPGYFTFNNAADTARQFGEFGFVAIGVAVVVISGGVDLSVGSIFALANFVVIFMLDIQGAPLWLAFLSAVGVGLAVGVVNGVLIGFLNLGAFLTTLITLLVVRALTNILILEYSLEMTGSYDSPAWSFLGIGDIAGVPTNIVALVIIALIGHLLLSRSRPGWYIAAIGANRRAARNAGISIRWHILGAYVVSGGLAAIGAVFYAARLNSPSADTGASMEILALTAVVLGGTALGGGKGSVGRALIGGVIVLVLTNGLVRFGLASGSTSAFLGAIMTLAVALDVKWTKNKHKAIDSIYVAPTYRKLGKLHDITPGSASPYSLNNRLRDAEVIGLGQVDGPEDVILDREGRLYCGTREGSIWRFRGENFETLELFARTGGRPLGMAFDRDDNLVVCVAGMGLYGITPQGKIFKMTDETNRTFGKLIDDSRLSLADDVDIAPDGKAYFSEATIRYDVHSWATDALEGRGNGRIICYDPKTGKTRTVVRDQVLPNGVCICHDGQSLLFASTWMSEIKRYWFDGPKKGRVEVFVDDLPGLPDNINRASDGTYWVALVGFRTPVYDLSMEYPDFRQRMVKRLPNDEWLYPNINNGCVVKLDENGKVREVLGDIGGISHPSVTSMREHKGYLYIGGLANNRIGRVKLPDADPDWTGPDSYWGPGRSPDQKNSGKATDGRR